MAWYRTGTITVTNGSTTVTGSGTAWIANAGIGEALYAPDGRLYEIANISSDTSITLASNYLGSNQSGQIYVIVPSQSYIRDLAAQAADLVNNYATVYNTVGQGKFGDGTLGTPAIRFNDDLDTGFYRSGTNEVTFVAGGVAQFKYNTSGISFTTAPTFTTPTIFNVNSASTALRITQTGAGNALVVEDSANPDATPFVVDANGRVLVGNATSRSDAGLVGNDKMQIEGVDYAGSSLALISNYSVNAGNQANIEFVRTRTGAVGGNTIVQSGDYLGAVNWFGSDGVDSMTPAAQIRADVDGTPGTNDMPGRLVFSTTADGASSPTERMRIDSAGQIIQGTSTGAVNGSLQLRRNITGGTTAYSVGTSTTIQSDVTGQASGYSTFINTAASAFTLNLLKHFNSQQGTIGATSAVTNQFGYFADSSLIGATNNYGFYSDIASGTGRWNFYANGTAANYFAGNTQIANYLDVTTVLAAGFGLRIRGESGGTYAGIQFTNNAANAQWAKIVSPSANVLTFQDGGNNERMRIDSAGNVGIGTSSPSTYNGKLVVKTSDQSVIGYFGGTTYAVRFGASPTVASIEGVDAATAITSYQPLQIGGSLLKFDTGGTERMRIDSAGRVGIGGTNTAASVYNGMALNFGANNYGFALNTSAGTGTTGEVVGYNSYIGASAGLSFGQLIHFRSDQAPLNSSTVTSQYGFFASSGLIGATNNYGFYSNIASGTGRWNFYANGTAANYFAGQTLIGSTTSVTDSSASRVFQVLGTSGANSAGLFARYSNDINPSALVLAKSRGAAVGTNTAVLSEDIIGRINFDAADGTGLINAAIIEARVDGSPGTNDMPGRLSFLTTPDGATTPVERVRISSTGIVALQGTSGLSIARTAVTAPAAADGNVFSGTYTPTLTNTTNVAASTAVECQYMRVGNVVTVSGRVSITATATGAIVLSMSLPVASNITAAQNIGGTAASTTGGQTNPLAIYGDATNDVALFYGAAQLTTSTIYQFSFTYRII